MQLTVLLNHTLGSVYMVLWPLLLNLACLWSFIFNCSILYIAIHHTSLEETSDVWKFKEWNISNSSSSVICQTTGPKPLPKRFLHTVRSRASSFNWQYPLLSLRSPSSFLRLLPRLLVTSICPFIFPSIICFTNLQIYILFFILHTLPGAHPASGGYRVYRWR